LENALNQKKAVFSRLQDNSQDFLFQEEDSRALNYSSLEREMNSLQSEIEETNGLLKYLKFHPENTLKEEGSLNMQLKFIQIFEKLDLEQIKDLQRHITYKDAIEELDKNYAKEINKQIKEIFDHKKAVFKESASMKEVAEFYKWKIDTNNLINAINEYNSTEVLAEYEQYIRVNKKKQTAMDAMTKILQRIRSDEISSVDAKPDMERLMREWTEEAIATHLDKKRAVRECEVRRNSYQEKLNECYDTIINNFKQIVGDNEGKNGKRTKQQEIRRKLQELKEPKEHEYDKLKLASKLLDDVKQGQTEVDQFQHDKQQAENKVEALEQGMTAAGDEMAKALERIKKEQAIENAKKQAQQNGYKTSLGAINGVERILKRKDVL